MHLLERDFPGVRDEVEKHHSLRADVIDAFSLLWTASTPTGENRASWGPRRAASATASRAPCPTHPSSIPAALRCRSGLDDMLRGEGAQRVEERRF